MSDDAIPVTSAAAVATPAANHDMTHSVTKLDRSIKQRRNVDETLINWWLFHFIVNPVTFGVYGIILYFKRINRIDRFGARKRAYYESLLEWSERFAIAQGKEADVRQRHRRPETAGIPYLRQRSAADQSRNFIRADLRDARHLWILRLVHG